MENAIKYFKGKESLAQNTNLSKYFKKSVDCYLDTSQVDYDYSLSDLTGIGCVVNETVDNLDLFIGELFKSDYLDNRNFLTQDEYFEEFITNNIVLEDLQTDKISVAFCSNCGWDPISYSKSERGYWRFDWWGFSDCNRYLEEVLNWVKEKSPVAVDSVIISLPRSTPSLGLLTCYVVKEIGWCTANVSKDSVYTNVEDSNSSDVKVVMLVNLVSALCHNVVMALEKEGVKFSWDEMGYYVEYSNDIEAMKFVYILAMLSQKYGYKANLYGNNILATKGFSREEAEKFYNENKAYLRKYATNAKIGDAYSGFRLETKNNKSVWRPIDTGFSEFEDLE